jgi:hypothetical protein
MTMVQFWLSGIMLDRLFTPRNSSPRRPCAGPANEDSASAQGQPQASPQTPASEPVGRVLDQVA